ncbi:unnamed protein product [Microthlaspi erraticum]|uniref:F-box domain-containing protein n=1 Tax=Microthlaspi erraticum TaxID=1685480 RepID=A0A6D2KK03_9BRAS|nr:unnamed protein product [Microthlaspi erraticum]CAA7054821.1 unnamed protein product [Microthlaspi erraticum]CAA7057215.1 unnamed protein product [Microthlaspi erraticum]
MNLEVEPLEKKRKTKNPLPPPSPPSFSLLPDEITVDCLARISRSYYPTLSTVSKSFRSLLSSSELIAARSHLGSTEMCVYVCLADRSRQHPQWFRLWINPNRTLPNSVTKKKKTIGQLLVPLPDTNLPSPPSLTTVAVGSEIYAIGGPVGGAPSSAVQVLDCRSHTWRDAPSMNLARKDALSCVYDGKIYVFGGCEFKDEPWGEVFDTKTQTWERLPDPGYEVSKFRVKRIREVEGKIFYGRFEEKNAYDTKQGKWEYGKPLVPKAPRSDVHLLRRNKFAFSMHGYLLYEVEGGDWKKLKGLDSLEDKYRRNGGCFGSIPRIVSCGGELFFIWEGGCTCRKKIWCAGIVLEERYGGEMWGNVEWVDVVHTVPTECRLLRCHAVLV